MKATLFLLSVLLLIVLSGCGGSDGGGSGNGRTVETGTVRFVALEGGFYGITTDTGASYLPLNLEDRFRRDGLRVYFTAVRRDVPNVQGWGIPVELSRVGVLTED